MFKICRLFLIQTAGFGHQINEIISNLVRVVPMKLSSGSISSYYTEPCVLLMADKVVNHDE
ncbi:hypothetical protein YK48G_11580 [Lentilactobacillus fungorum]|uniref:Uncharacterized protein n=1 Tax=Lentilactobacillus fungorum TaxID=2201250 RepID=A0ABQ3VZ94_9LACO|nr:hypothetical protein YK48G_11580 [Lentilactobacillus fungorum]